ncbi:MAG: sulfatase-like hydrolase/transferase [Candidatus Sumerlaeota bacterium]|nr:sulfatase-like hydrolase/transferase [Candidatus Sumerlaeota bacterium]
MPQHPNLLLIMTDQQSADALSGAGNPYLRAPAMDRLAAEGVRFERAYCAQPLCVPSRVAMMTGRMPHELGATHNVRSYPGCAPILGSVLSATGYDCAWFGKWHLAIPTEDAATHGFAAEAGLSWNPFDHRDALVPRSCAEFLQQRRARPFFVVASFRNPHDICQWARREPLPQGDIPALPPPGRYPPLPGNFEVPENEPELLRMVRHSYTRLHPTLDWTPDDWRQYRWAYCRLVEKVDALVGRTLDALRESGHEDDTLVFFTSDHGDGGGSHRWNQKQALYEQPCRIPFIARWTGATKGGAVDSRHLVSSGLDLVPTICDYAGAPPPPGLRGRSLRPLIEGRAPEAWRDSLAVETEFANMGERSDGWMGRMIVTDRYKYIVYSQGERREQLFDLREDPGETRNLVASADRQAVVADHRRRLAEWIAETSDAFVMPDGR